MINKMKENTLAIIPPLILLIPLSIWLAFILIEEYKESKYTPIDWSKVKWSEVDWSKLNEQYGKLSYYFSYDGKTVYELNKIDNVVRGYNQKGKMIVEFVVKETK